MDGLMTANSGEMVCTTKSGRVADGLTTSEISAVPLRPHFGQLRTTPILAWVLIQEVWASDPL
jgi:hypothetical protein